MYLTLISLTGGDLESGQTGHMSFTREAGAGAKASKLPRGGLGYAAHYEMPTGTPVGFLVSGACCGPGA
jgi:hypothetical protein